jgi:hypothetical protein
VRFPENALRNSDGTSVDVSTSVAVRFAATENAASATGSAAVGRAAMARVTARGSEAAIWNASPAPQSRRRNLFAQLNCL